MIAFEEATFDPYTTHQRLAVLECLAKGSKLHCYSNVDALDYTLSSVVQEMNHHRANGWTMPDGLCRMVLIFTDSRAIKVVQRHMAHGWEFAFWPQPEAWHDLYSRIEDFRARARQYDPDFKPRYR